MSVMGALRTSGASLILTVSSCVYVQMLSTPWAGMMCVLQASYHEGDQTEAADQPHQGEKYTHAPGSPPRQVHDFSGDDVVAVRAADQTGDVSQVRQ